MDAIDELESELQQQSRHWERLEQQSKTPRTAMSVVEYSLDAQRKAEEYVNRPLRYFLDPSEHHGMDADFLQAFLEGMPTEGNFQEDLSSLTDAQVDDQVTIRTADPTSLDDDDDQSGRVDLVVEASNEWFCWSS